MEIVVLIEAATILTGICYANRTIRGLQRYGKTMLKRHWYDFLVIALFIIAAYKEVIILCLLLTIYGIVSLLFRKIIFKKTHTMNNSVVDFILDQ